MSAPPGTFRLPNGGLLALVTVHELLTLNARKAKDGGCFESIGAELKQRNSEYLAFAVLCKNLPTQDTPPLGMLEQTVKLQKSSFRRCEQVSEEVDSC